MRWRAVVDGRELELELTPEGVELGEGRGPVEIAGVPGTEIRHLRLGDRGWTLVARRMTGGWEIGIGGHRLRVELEDERSRHIRELAGARTAPAPRTLTAPMPGLVLRVEVEPGQRVEAGTPLLVIEAMKMENELRAPGAVTVTSVEVREGQTVNRDDVLVRFE